MRKFSPDPITREYNKRRRLRMQRDHRGAEESEREDEKAIALRKRILDKMDEDQAAQVDLWNQT